MIEVVMRFFAPFGRVNGQRLDDLEFSDNLEQFF